MSDVPDRPDPARALVVGGAAGRGAEICEVLARNGWTVSETDPDEIGPDRAVWRTVDAVVVVVDDARHLDAARAVRRVTDVVVVAVTDQDLVAAFDTGVDDVVATDAVRRELPGRLAARAHRRTHRAVVRGRIELPGLVLDRDARSVRVEGTRVELTPREYDLLAYLAERPGQIVSRDALLRDVWGSSSEWQQARTVNEHVRRLRNKIGERWILTLRGYGYRFDAQAAPTPDPD